MTAPERFEGAWIDEGERGMRWRPAGWLVTGSCGRGHLVGKGWSWWRCPLDHRQASKDRITAAQRRLMAMYYPEPK